MALNTIPNKGLTSRGYPSDRITTPIIINGDMKVAQRGTSTSSVTGNGYFACDRFKNIISGLGTWTVSQSTDVPTGQGFSHSFKMDCTTADASPAAGDFNVLAQIVEGANIQSLKKGTSSAESVTYSFWVKSNKTGTYICEIFDSNNTRQISKSYTISSANTWEKKIISFPGDTSGAIGTGASDFLQFNWWLAVGSDRSSGTLSTTWTSTTNANRAVGQVNLADSTDNEWYITGVQLEVGEFDSTTIPSFPFESFENNLRKCMRYFQIYMNAASANKDFLGGHIHDNDTFRMSLTFPVEFRTTPSLSSSSSGSADHWRVITSSINTNYGSAITFTGSTKSGQFTLVDTGGTDMSSHVDDPGYMQNNQSSCYLKMDAEL